MSGFAAGLLVGQLSVLVVIAVMLKFFLFADSPTPKGMPPSESWPPETEASSADAQSLDEILEHTYYDVETHVAESMDWFTVLGAMAISSLRQQALVNGNLLNLLNKILQSDRVPSFIDSMRVKELDLGRDYPLLNNCKVYRSANSAFSDGLEAQFDVDLKDKITLGLETRLVLNYPRAMLGFLPIEASVSLVNFSGRVSVSLVTGDDGLSYVTFMFAPTFSMEFQVHSLLGDRSKLQDVPKLGQMVETALRKRFADKCVFPNFQKIKLPAWHTSVAADAATPPTASTTSTASASEAVNPSLETEVSSAANGSATASAGVSTGVSGAPNAAQRLYDPVMQRKVGEKYSKVAHDRS